MDMATLYIRNVPAGLYERLRKLAEEHGRSLNAEVLDLLADGADAWQEDTDAARSLAAYFERYGDQPVPVPDVVELIHEGRQREWHRNFGI